MLLAAGDFLVATLPSLLYITCYLLCAVPSLRLLELVTTYCLLTPSNYHYLRTTHYLLPTSYYLLPTTYQLLPTIPTTYYLLLPTTYYLLPTTYYLLPGTRLHFNFKTLTLTQIQCTGGHPRQGVIATVQFFFRYPIRPMPRGGGLAWSGVVVGVVWGGRPWSETATRETCPN